MKSLKILLCCLVPLDMQIIVDNISVIKMLILLSTVCSSS